MITQNDLNNWFEYHPPMDDQRRKYEEIRKVGALLTSTILQLTPHSADQSAAIRKVREAVMTANAAIACDILNSCSPQIDD